MYALSPAGAGSKCLLSVTLGLAPQALCFRPLRGLVLLCFVALTVAGMPQRSSAGNIDTLLSEAGALVQDPCAAGTCGDATRTFDRPCL